MYGSKAGRKSKQNKPEIISSNISVSRALDISPDGSQLARAGDNAKIIVSDAQTGELIQEVDANQGRRIWDVKYTPNGVGLICSGDDGQGGTSIQYANLSGGASPIIGKTPFRVTRIDVSSEGKYIAGSGKSSEVWIWNIQNQRREFKLDDPNSDKMATAVSFNPQGRFAAVGYQDGTVMLWDLNKVNANKNYRPEKFLFHGAKISDIDFSPDGTKLVVGSFDGTASLWTVRNNQFKGYDDDQVVNEDSIDSSVVSCNEMQKLETLKVNLIVKASDIDNEYIRPVCQRAKHIFSKLAPDNKWNELERKDVPVLKELGFSLEVAFLKETVIL